MVNPCTSIIMTTTVSLPHARRGIISEVNTVGGQSVVHDDNVVLPVDSSRYWEVQGLACGINVKGKLHNTAIDKVTYV